jgi:hypothetical protein
MANELPDAELDVLARKLAKMHVGELTELLRVTAKYDAGIGMAMEQALGDYSMESLADEADEDDEPEAA